MSEPTLALQGAIYGALRGGAVNALVGGRVYDQVPAGTQKFPYVTIGDDQAVADHAECLEGSVEATATINVWSRDKNGKQEAKTISGAVVRDLNNVDLSLNGYRLVLIEHEASRHLDDPDGITSHSVITFRALIDEVG